MMEAIHSSDTSVFAESHGVTTQKTPFFIVTAVKTSKLTTSKELASVTGLLSGAFVFGSFRIL
jgi:hypothetical protein